VIKSWLKISVVLAFVFTPLVSLAASLDNYYLERFTVSGSHAYRATVPGEQDVHTAERCMMPLHHGLNRDWNKLSGETRKSLAKYLAKPVLANELTYTSSGGHFRVHYTKTDANNAPPLADLNRNNTPDWVETVASTFEQVYQTEVITLGYRPAPTFNSAPYDIYLLDLATQRFYGTTNSDPATDLISGNSYTSYIELDRSFTSPIYGGYTPLQSLQITAAHEYHHAIQYGYSYFFDIWYAEVTSTWMEDEVFDEINQLYSYIPDYLRNPMSIDAPAQTGNFSEYGRWIFNRYLAETYGSDVIKSFWVTLAGKSSPTGADIPALPIIQELLSSRSPALPATFTGFSKRLYQRDWNSHRGDISLIHTVTPVATYSTYPQQSTTTTLPHYSFAYYKFLPSASAPTALVLTLTLGNGVEAVAFKKSSSGQVVEIVPDSALGTITIPDFNSSGTSEAVLLFVNNSSQDGIAAGFTTLCASGIALTANSLTGPPPLNVTFTASLPDCPAITRYEWDFGSGTFQEIAGVGATASHRFSAAGTYLVRVRATSSSGQTVTAEVQAAATSTGYPAVALTASNLTGPAPLSVDFTATPSGTSSSALRYEWDLGDGNFASYPGVSTRMSKTFSSSGSYVVRTRLIDEQGRTALAGVEVVVIAGAPAETPSGSTTISSNKNGCFIATAAYGSYLHPKVRLLREFRDRYLLTSTLGRLLVEQYYLVSPPVADFLARHELLRLLTRVLLTPIVLAVEYLRLFSLLVMLVLGGAMVRLFRRT
jgi:PKD repeat protein